MPLRKSSACGPVTDIIPLCGIGANVGVFRTSARAIGGIITVYRDVIVADNNLFKKLSVSHLEDNIF